MTEPWEQPTFAAAETAAWDALAKATPEDLHHMGVTLGQAGVTVEEAAASIGAVWALASQVSEWQQPTACLHTGDRITDQMIAEADPRIICAECGQQIIDEPATNEPFVGAVWDFELKTDPYSELWAAIERGETIYIADHATGQVIGQLGEPIRQPDGVIRLTSFRTGDSPDPDQR